jgi:hypothetical protein
MHPLPRHFSMLCLALTSACSTVVEGTSQSITVSSEPAGAQCFIEQAGDIVGRVTTPGSATIGKSKNDLVISCSKDGYESVKVKNRADMAITSLGNMAFYQLGFLGSAVDSATGASNKYDSKVFVTLIPSGPPLAFPVPPGAPIVTQLPTQSLAGLTMQPPMPAALLQPGPTLHAAPAPQALLPAPTPSIHAAVALAKAAIASIEQQQVAQLSYAEQMAQATRRPPFEITQ